VFEVFVVFAILIGGYVLSLKLNPWVLCSNCKNSPKIKGLVASHAHHVCRKCKGTGQTLRFGRRFIFGEPSKR
jgi:hypothetical protein